jgi:ATP-binding cassette subfamily B protein
VSAPADPARPTPSSLLRPVAGRLALAVLLQAAAALAGVLPFVAVVEIGRRLLEGRPAAAVWPLLGIAAAALAARLVLVAAAGLVSHLADNELTLSLRRRVAGHVGRLPLGWFDRRGSGQVQRAVSDDITAMHAMVAHAWPDLVAALVGAAATLGYLLVVDWRLALVALLPVAGGRWARRLIIRSVAAYQGRYAAATAEVTSAAVELMQGIAVVKTFSSADSAADPAADPRGRFRLARATTDAADAFEALRRPMTRTVSITKASTSPATVSLLVLAAGVAFLGLGWSRPVDVLAAALLGIGLGEQLGLINYVAAENKQARDAAGRVAGLLGTPAVPVVAHPRVPEGNRVEFVGVRFAYPGPAGAAPPDDDHGPEAGAGSGGEVLRGVDAVLEPGTVTALVGRSGAGKSTMALLLPRFFDADAGSVRIGGVDVRDMAAGQLYRHVGFVLQDVRLLRTSIRDNIRLGRPDAPHDEVVAAARAAQVHDRIEALAGGYDAVVGESAWLSGGERQRVSIARALLADAPILVLDEATAFADPESESAIQDALSRLVAGRTVLVIAHRLATVVNVDQILVLDAGRVIERGRHAELLATGGHYAALWARQAGSRVEEVR